MVNLETFQDFRCRGSFPQEVHLFGNSGHGKHTFCILHQHLLKASDGAISGQHRRNALCAPKSLSDPKCILCPKCNCSAKMFVGENAMSSKKFTLELLRTHIPIIFFCLLATIIPKKQFPLQNTFHSKSHSAPFAILDPKVHLLRKIAPFRPHAAGAYKTIGMFMELEPFLAQKLFWTKNAFWAPKSISGLKMRKIDPEFILGPKVHFTHKLPKS